MMQTDGRTRAQWLLLVVVAMVGLNLRPFLTAIGPLASIVSKETGLNYQGTALLTLVPMLLMGICAFTAPFCSVSWVRGVLSL